MRATRCSIWTTCRTWRSAFFIEQPSSPDAPVVASQLPAGVVASAVHRGPYDELGAAHDAVHTFCRDRALPLAGPRWEIYGHGDEDPARIEIAVNYLLAG